MLDNRELLHCTNLDRGEKTKTGNSESSHIMKRFTMEQSQENHKHKPSDLNRYHETKTNKTNKQRLYPTEKKRNENKQWKTISSNRKSIDKESSINQIHHSSSQPIQYTET